MSDAKAKSGGMLKAAVGTVAGLLSGGAMMYVSPLVDRVVKPQKPMANFAVEATGLQVTLHNRSTGGDGWWDFGDGSALEPAPADGGSVTHIYAKPGSYTVKLSLRSFFGDENERTVQVEAAAAANTTPPAILDLKAIPVSSQAIAPATFRLVGTARNADVAVWDVEEQMVIVKDSPNQQERLVTFTTPGRHVVQFAVLNGAASEKRALPIEVKPAPTNAILAVLRVADQGTKVERQTTTDTIPLTPDAKAKPFERTVAARAGFKYAEAALAGPAPAGVKNVTVQVSPDRTQVKVAGELLAATVKPGQSKPAIVALPLKLTMEKQSADSRKPVDTTAPLTVPGTTVLPLAALPGNWANPKRQVGLDLKYGAQSLMKTAAFPYTNALKMGNRTYTLTATLAGDQVRIDVQ